MGRTPARCCWAFRFTVPAARRSRPCSSPPPKRLPVAESIPCLGGILSFAAWIYIAVTIENSPTKRGKHDELAGGARSSKPGFTAGLKPRGTSPRGFSLSGGVPLQPADAGAPVAGADNRPGSREEAHPSVRGLQPDRACPRTSMVATTGPVPS